MSIILRPYSYQRRYERGIEVDDAGDECTNSGYVLIARKGLVLRVVGLEDTEGKGKCCAGD